MDINSLEDLLQSEEQYLNCFFMNLDTRLVLESAPAGNLYNRVYRRCGIRNYKEYKSLHYSKDKHKMSKYTLFVEERDILSFCQWACKQFELYSQISKQKYLETPLFDVYNARLPIRIQKIIEYR